MNNEKQTVPNENLLDIKDLSVNYVVEKEVTQALRHVSFSMKKGETLGLVGETGAGKTTLALSIMNMIPNPPGHIVGGEIIFEGEDIVKKNNNEMRKIRGHKISMIYQDPMTSLNPIFPIGQQIEEVILLHQNVEKEDVHERGMKILESVGIPRERYNEYPHQFSGGMKQRVIIAIALACNPELLLADEPTTALDVTIQAQILHLMRELKEKQKTSVILITHDLGVVAGFCDRVAIVYAGEIVEIGTLEDIFDNPLHPYTLGLFGSIPSLSKDVDRLTPIPGMMPDSSCLPEGCAFCERCTKCSGKCAENSPEMLEITPGHFVKCHLFVKGEK